MPKNTYLSHPENNLLGLCYLILKMFENVTILVFIEKHLPASKGGIATDFLKAAFLDGDIIPSKGGMIRTAGDITPSEVAEHSVGGVMHQMGHVNRRAATYLRRARHCLRKAAQWRIFCSGNFISWETSSILRAVWKLWRTSWGLQGATPHLLSGGGGGGIMTGGRQNSYGGRHDDFIGRCDAFRGR